MKAYSPAQSLLVLVLGGLAIAGWFYGLHWKRVASGDLFSSDEKLMIRLQDQIETLSAENAALHKHLRELGGESAPEAVPKVSTPADSVAPIESVTLPSSGPVLPAPPRKIETH